MGETIMATFLDYAIIIILTISIIGWVWAIYVVNNILVQRNQELEMIKELFQDMQSLKESVKDQQSRIEG
jgi:hypothetical protein